MHLQHMIQLLKMQNLVLLDLIILLIGQEQIHYLVQMIKGLLRWKKKFLCPVFRFGTRFPDMTFPFKVDEKMKSDKDIPLVCAGHVTTTSLYSKCCKKRCFEDKIGVCSMFIKNR